MKDKILNREALLSYPVLYVVRCINRELDVFSESESGVLDFAGFVKEDCSFQDLQRFLRDTHEYIETELVIPGGYGNPVYERYNEKPVVSRFARQICPPGETSYPFMFRYPEWRNLCIGGNYADAGKIIQLSKKLKNQFPLLRYIAGDDSFWIFAFYYLMEWDNNKQAALAQLFSGRTGDGYSSPIQNYDSVFRFAKDSIEANDVQSFNEELKAKLKTFLVDQKKEMVLPVVGSNFRNAVSSINHIAEAAKKEGYRKMFNEDTTKVFDNVRQWFEKIDVYVQPEPWNKYDPNALAVYVRKPEDGQTEHAGYIRRDIAAVCAPIVKKGYTFRARLYSLDSSVCRLGLRV